MPGVDTHTFVGDKTAAELIHSPVRPTAPLQTLSRECRPTMVGPDEPEEPFPVIMKGAVQRGFGRGGRELGCLTANLPDESLDPMTSVAKPGIYFGYARVHFGDKAPESDRKVWPMVMSMGWNPYYKNEKLTAETRTGLRFAGGAHRGYRNRQKSGPQVHG
ncbi:hypothetical protein OPQ81_009509 [Rhizoctonia solani]|nr:hypothetical protein OPQ81_009509 [Rhizoctonia solani]